jgi:hypothetical protein
LLDTPGELFHQSVINAVLRELAVGADASLADVAVFDAIAPSTAASNIGIIEDDEGRVAAQFHRRPFDGVGALLEQHFPDFGSSRRLSLLRSRPA